MLKKLVALICLGVMAVGLQACQKPKPETACNFVQNSKMQRVSWGAMTPVVLYIDGSVPSYLYSPIERAVEAWNARIGRELLKLGGPINSQTGPGQDGANVIYWMTDWEPDRRYEQARTTVVWSGDRLVDADVRVNARDFRYSDGRQVGYVDFESLMVHEFGHVLGLTHIDEPGSVMAKSLANNTERRVPSDTDVGSLRCEY